MDNWPLNESGEQCARERRTPTGRRAGSGDAGPGRSDGRTGGR